MDIQEEEVRIQTEKEYRQQDHIHVFQYEDNIYGRILKYKREKYGYKQNRNIYVYIHISNLLL